MKRIKITWAVGASSGLLFTGFVLGWPQNDDLSGDGTVTISCVDGSRFLENSPLAGSMYAAEVLDDAPFAYWPLQSNLDDEVGDGDLREAPDYPVSYVDVDVPVGEAKALTIDAAAAYRDVLSGWPSYPETYEFWAQADGAALDFQVTYTVASSYRITITGGGNELEVEYTNSVSSDKITVPLDTNPHLWTVTTPNTTLGTMRLYRDGVEVGSVTLGAASTAFTYSSVSVAGYDNARISHVSLYSTELGSARILAHYQAGEAAPYPTDRTVDRVGRVLDEMGWPSGDRNIDDGDTWFGAYLPARRRPMDYLREIERAEQGLMFFDVDGDLRFIGRNALWTATSVATFSDDGVSGSVRYRDATRGSHHDTIRNTVTATWAGGLAKRSDSTSITAYGEAAEAIETAVLPNHSRAANLAAYRLRESKDPQVRLSNLTSDVRAPGGDNEAATLLAVEIGDRVSVERTPPAGAPYTYTLLVLGVKHRITLNRWTVEFYTSPQTDHADAPYLTVGHDVLGRIGTFDSPLQDENGDALTDETGADLLDEDSSTAGNLVPY